MNKRLGKLIHPTIGIYFISFLVFSLVCAFFSVPLAGAGVLLCVLLYLAHYIAGRVRRRLLAQYLSGLPFELEGRAIGSLNDSPLPLVVALAATGEILWCNDRFEEAVGRRDLTKNVRLQELAEGFDTRWLMEGRRQYPAELQVGQNYFSVYGSLSQGEDRVGVLMILYFLPCTEYVDMRSRFERNQPAVAIISIDNYEELTKDASDSEKSFVLAAIDRIISDWASGTGALLRKYDRDKYIFIVNETTLNQLAEGKFSVLDGVRTVQSHGGITATLSIGVGKDGATFDEDYQYSSLALEMALSRGGDQAVIKNKYTFEFYGGLSKEVEKRTKVKSRVIANALSQLIRDSSQVLVMGHSNSDFDAFGAAVGMACAARTQEKPVHIVINSERTLAGALLHRMQELPEYKGIFISADEAMVLCDFNTLLIVVDTNRPDYVESPPLLESINKVAVIDHHRRAASYIENCAVNLHEPYASSACELVTELLQYMAPNRAIMRDEAECMLAGIYLDTKGFSVKAGVRTFEAAAYLKRAGADMVRVKKLFQSTFDEYMVRQKIISSAHNCAEGIVLAASDVSTSRAVAAQAADELLNIMGVRASIVATRSGSDVAVSARSLGKVNVQIIMEALGGGGNLASAGAQLGAISIEEAEKRIADAVTAYTQENDTKSN